MSRVAPTCSRKTGKKKKGHEPPAPVRGGARMTENETAPFGGGGKNVVGSSIAERRAATCGFKPTPRLSTARFRSSGASPPSSPAAVVIRSPFVTIPPGISPTTLLDSPVMLFHSQALQSPTTGSFQIPHVEHETTSHAVENANAGKDNHFMFRNQPIAPSSISFFQNTDINQVFPPLNHKEKQQIGSGDNGSICREECSVKQMQQYRSVISNASVCSGSKQMHRPNGSSSNGEDDIIPQLLQLFEEDELARFASLAGRRSEDRYNCQKYGRQKQVECSEVPLSLKFHRQKPPPPPQGSAFLYSDSISELSDSTAGVAVGGWPPESKGGPGDETSASLKVEASLDWASSASAITTELSDAPPPSTAQAKCSSMTTIGADGEDEDDDDKSESKRRKGESSMTDSSTPPSSVREPRVVVQTVSEIDILEDGYRWRKYGQKVVKGNPNPRSYYKCTFPGCSVRKLVERASYDLKSVITTYEGKHNHAVPAGKSQKPAAAASAAAATAAQPADDLFRGCQEIYELLSCRARRNAASFHSQIGGISALAFGSLPSGVPFPVPNLDRSLAFRVPTTSFHGGDSGFGDYRRYDRPRASAGEVVEFLHGQQKSTEEDDMSFGMLPMEEHGNADLDSYTR